MSSFASGEEQGTMLAFVVPGNDGSVGGGGGGVGGSVVRVPVPSPLPGHALIRVLRAGVCNTDLEILKGYMGFTGVLGHEFVGVVEQINLPPAPDGKGGEGEGGEGGRPDYRESIWSEWIGARVCGDINVGCGTCLTCLDSDGRKCGRGGGPTGCASCSCSCCSKMGRNHCPRRSVLGILNKDGTMAQYLTLPLKNLHKVPRGMSDEQAVFAEPLAAACRIVEQGLVMYADECGKDDDDDDAAADGGGCIKPDRVAILGDGKLGLMIAEVLGREHVVRNASRVSDPPVLFGKHQAKMDLVRNSGVTCLPISDAVQCNDGVPGRGTAARPEHSARYDVVVDATGNPAGLGIAAQLCRPMGTLVLKSTCADGEKFNAAPFVIDELKVIGSRCGPIDRTLELLDIKASGEKGEGDGKHGCGVGVVVHPLRVEKYVTKTFPLAKADEAIRCAAEKNTMKVQIICSDI